MNILPIFLLLFAAILLILVIIDFPIKQKWINIFLLAIVVFIVLSGAGWISGLSLHK